MSTCMRKKIEEESMVMQKQGIVTILGSNQNVTATSLRRTLSADMSSKTWLSQNGFSHSHTTKLTAADSSSSSEGEDEYEEEMKRERFQICDTTQKKEQNEEKPGQFDIWSSILSHKEETSKLTTTPYVHPLVRRSKSCLSAKSLEICTESLGSETGSDGFSSYPPSESADSDSDEEEEVKRQTICETKVVEENQRGKEIYTSEKKPLSRCFPPPLPSLQMRAHRDNGRLLLQAVSVPNNFCAQRRDGRLVLTFANEEVADEEEEKDEEVEEFVEGEEAEEVESEIEKTPMLSTSVHRLALMINKPIGLVNIDMSPKWSEKLNDVTNFKDVNVVKLSTLPPRPRTRLIPSSTASGAFNAYENYWRTKPPAKAGPFKQMENNSNQTSSDGQQLLVLRGKNGDYSVHNLKNCKDSRRSILFWEPHCIAT